MLSVRACEGKVEEYSLAGVGLTSRRTTEEKRHLAVGNGLLGQVIVDNDGMLAIIPEILTCQVC